MSIQIPSAHAGPAEIARISFVDAIQPPQRQGILI